jgi:hypothetical protein
MECLTRSTTYNASISDDENNVSSCAVKVVSFLSPLDLFFCPFVLLQHHDRDGLNTVMYL